MASATSHRTTNRFHIGWAGGFDPEQAFIHELMTPPDPRQRRIEFVTPEAKKDKLSKLPAPRQR